MIEDHSLDDESISSHDGSKSFSSSCETGTGHLSTEEERDEIREIRKLAQKETTRVRLWRFVVASVLLITALAVTLITYFSLEKEEAHKFKTAVSFHSLISASILSLADGTFVSFPPV